MKTFFGVVLLGLIVTAVLVAEVVQMFIAAAPYLLVFVLVFWVVRTRVHRSATRPGVPRSPARPATPARSVTTSPTGWVLVPMWMGPRSSHLPVIDAEVIDERRGPT